MSPSTESEKGINFSILAGAWRPVGLVYLLMLLAALTIGLWPQVVYPSRKDVVAAPLLPLQTIAVAQAGFVLLIYPLAVFARSQHRPAREGWLSFCAGVLEFTVLIIVTVPLYIIASYLADAVVADVIRTVIYIALLFPAGWLVGRCLSAGGARRTAAMLAVLLAMLALPAVWYIVAEFTGAGSIQWLWRLAPATFAWENAASRLGSPVPSPLWPALIWPALAAGGGLVNLLARPLFRLDHKKQATPWTSPE